MYVEILYEFTRRSVSSNMHLLASFGGSAVWFTVIYYSNIFVLYVFPDDESINSLLILQKQPFLLTLKSLSRLYASLSDCKAEVRQTDRQTNKWFAEEILLETI